MGRVGVFDVEADGFLHEASQIWCAGIYDVSADKYTYYGRMGYGVLRFLRDLNTFDVLVAHNCVNYDIKLIKKLYPMWKLKPHVELIDTLVLAKFIIWKDKLKKSDQVRGIVPPKLWGSYSLKAFGIRMAYPKGDYTDFTRWAPEMVKYLKRDVMLNYRLYQELIKADIPWKTFNIEMQTREIMADQMENGIRFDKQLALEVKQKLEKEKEDILNQLQKQFPPFYTYADKNLFVPARNDRRLGYTKGAPCQKIKLVEFSPTSKHHVALKLLQLGYIPEAYQDKDKVKPDIKYQYERLGIQATTNPKITYKTLQRANIEGSSLIKRYTLLDKRLGQLANGKNAFLKRLVGDRVYPQVDSLGANSRRMTHHKFNSAQVPNGEKPYGPEFRAMFLADKGWDAVGMDSSSLESRMKAHGLFPFDKGDFIKVVETGKIHDMNMQYLDVKNKGIAKGFYFAYCFGGQEYKLGSILLADPNYSDYEGDRAELGGKMVAAFKERFPGLGDLIDMLQAESEQGWIRAIDGSMLPVDQPRKALNVYTQGNGAIYMKKFLCMFADELNGRGYYNGKDFKWLNNVHDEVLMTTRKEISQEVLDLGLEMFLKAGEYYELNVKMPGAGAVGANWYEVH